MTTYAASISLTPVTFTSRIFRLANSARDSNVRINVMKRRKEQKEQYSHIIAVSFLPKYHYS